jgi:alkylation response protein AidB-like acyl-CoA dehydrogenase
MPYAADANVAGLVLLTDGDELREGVPEGGLPSMDETRRVFRLRAGERLAAGPAVAEARAKALDLGALAGAAQLLGAGRALLDASARYAGYREQFGHPIGQFQAVKHRLADVAIGLEFARPLLYAAAVAVAGDTSTAGRDISAAKVACATAADRAARAVTPWRAASPHT